MRIAGQPTVVNGTLTDADTEYSITPPANYKRLLIQARQNALVKFAFTGSTSGTEYVTLKAGAVYFEDGLRTNTPIYVQSPVAGTVVEFLFWSGGDN